MRTPPGTTACSRSRWCCSRRWCRCCWCSHRRSSSPLLARRFQTPRQKRSPGPAGPGRGREQDVSPASQTSQGGACPSLGSPILRAPPKGPRRMSSDHMGATRTWFCKLCFDQSISTCGSSLKAAGSQDRREERAQKHLFFHRGKIKSPQRSCSTPELCLQFPLQ